MTAADADTGPRHVKLSPLADLPSIEGELDALGNRSPETALRDALVGLLAGCSPSVASDIAIGKAWNERRRWE